MCGWTFSVKRGTFRSEMWLLVGSIQVCRCRGPAVDTLDVHTNVCLEGRCGKFLLPMRSCTFWCSRRRTSAGALAAAVGGAGGCSGGAPSERVQRRWLLLRVALWLQWRGTELIPQALLRSSFTFTRGIAGVVSMSCFAGLHVFGFLSA